MNSTSEISDQIKIIAQKSGAELIGIAPADILEKQAPEGHRPSDLLGDAKSIIVVAGGYTLNEDRNYINEIGLLSTFTFIDLKDRVKLERRRTRACVQTIHDFLIENGYKSKIESHGWSDILSFKQASYYAGLGVFGKGTFIIHPKYGTINVLGVIVTDAILKYDKPMDMDLCGKCRLCIKVCRYQALKEEDSGYFLEEEKCVFYNIQNTPSKKIITYGPCNGDCINFCPSGDKIVNSNNHMEPKTMNDVLKSIIDEIKPYLGNPQKVRENIRNIQKVFEKNYLKPVNYEGILKETGFVVWIEDKELEKSFQCKKIWIELSSLNNNLFNKIYDLKDLLNHEWLILILGEDGTYEVHKPLIWTKIKGLKDFTIQI